VATQAASEVPVVTESVRERVQAICDQIIQRHLDLFLLLLAQKGKPKDVQIDRGDTLVRSLLSFEVADTLFENGRRIPVLVDTEVNPPLIKINAEFVERVADDELLFIFTRPITQILRLPTINVGLVLQGTDEKQLRNLFHGASRKLSNPVASSNAVPAVVERRLMKLGMGTRSLVSKLTAGTMIKLASPRDFLNKLLQMPTWPEFDDIASEPFIAHTIRVMREALEPVPTKLPPAALLVELMWDSLNLSPSSFLRHAGRMLRTQGHVVTEPLLTEFARVITDGRPSTVLKLENWPAFRELQSAWEKLFALEMRALNDIQLGNPEPPAISALGAPGISLGLREPTALPWSYPLVCWSVRETDALRDLLMGFVQSHRASQDRSKDLTLDLVFGHDDHALDVSSPPRKIRIEMINQDVPSPDGYDMLAERAFDAAMRRLDAQIMSLDHNTRLQALHRIRGAYDGFFSGAKQVWERRLQGWQQDDPHEAIRRLAAEVREVLDCPVFVDPFESPSSTQFRMIPTFCFIVALTSQLDSVPFRIPISSIVMTNAAGTPPMVVRMVEVPDGGNDACVWVGDNELTMRTFEGRPVHQTLSAVDDNMLRLIAIE